MGIGLCAGIGGVGGLAGQTAIEAGRSLGDAADDYLGQQYQQLENAITDMYISQDPFFNNY